MTGPEAHPPPPARPQPAGPAPPPGYDACNRYTRVIVDEALRRGITVAVRDPAAGELVLRLGDRTMTTFESLSELTSAVAVRICSDKGLTRRVLADAGLPVPAGQRATGADDDHRFLARHGEIVVKPVVGEGGAGITVGVRDDAALDRALARAREVHPDVLLEQCVTGDDVRVVVIDDEVVAASVRRPPVVVGDGRATVAELVDALSRRRAEETDGAAHVPLDAVTLDVLAAAGVGPDDVLAEGTELAVRRTANVHTGGTITDVTAHLDPAHGELALAVAAAVAIPVVGVDLFVTAVDRPGAVVIEANEQPGLANHEPQPTVERFVDLLFPGTADRA